MTFEPLGPYRIVSALGRGGMGVVYEALHETTGARVALKTVTVVDPERLGSVRREIQTLAAIRHPGIVRIVDLGVAAGLPWYAMELIDGVTLRRWASDGRPEAELEAESETGPTAPLRERGRESGSGPTAVITPAPELTEPFARRSAAPPSPARRRGFSVLPGETLARIASVVGRLCDPLAYLHGEGIVHRDLKPDNVLVRSGGDPVIVDFGLVARFAAGEGRETLEVTGEITGTAAYMAPEQGRGELVDARADLYALGCILYELLTGRPPFEGPTAADVLMKHLLVPPAPPSILTRGVPPEMDELVLRLLAKDPKERFGYAADVARALGPFALPLEERWTPAPRPYLYRPACAGRDDLLRELGARGAALDDGKGGFLLLSGEAGSGKTRMLGEASALFVGRGQAVIVGQARSDPGAPPLPALHGLFTAVADRCRAGGAPAFDRLLGSRGKALAAHVRELAGLPGLERFPDPAQLPADAALLRLSSYVAQTLHAFAGDRPLALLLDDLHTADGPTRSVLHFLLKSRSLARMPVLVLGTCRSEPGESPLGPIHELADERRLGRLDRAAIELMVSTSLAMDPAPGELSRAVTDRSRGNPFFAAELLKVALADGLLARDAEGRWRLSDRGRGRVALPLPDSVRDLVARRLGAIPERTRLVASLCAVLGESWEEPLLAVLAGEILGIGDTELGAILADLERREIVETGAGALVRVPHAETRDALEALVPEADRSAWHRRAAERLATTLAVGDHAAHAAVARHWEAAGDRAAARRHYLEAGTLASNLYVFEAAERFLAAYLSLVEAATPESVSARAELGGRVLRHRGQLARASAEVERAIAEARAIGDRQGEEHALRSLANILELGGRLEESHRLYEQAHAIALEIGDRRNVGVALAYLALSHANLGRGDLAEELYGQALAVHREVGARRDEALTLGNYAVLQALRGKHEEALALFESQRTIMREVGDRFMEARALAGIAEVRWELGDEGAEALFRDAIVVLKENGDRRFEALTLANLGRYFHDMSLPGAQGLLAEALAIQREIGDRRMEASTIAALADLLAGAHRNEEALDRYVQMESLASALHDARAVAEAVAGQGSVLQALGRFDEARSALSRAASTAVDPSQRGDVHRRLGRHHRERGDVEAAVAALEAADAIADPADLVASIALLCERARLAVARGNDPAPWLAAARERLASAPRGRAASAAGRHLRALERDLGSTAR
ncbi:MAG: protein kinase [Acidobacteriota bacterium]